MDEGYIKFNQQWTDAPLDPSIDWQSIELIRAPLYKAGCIGAYENGIGYGNISRRLPADQFLITGSATGNLPQLQRQHYALVTKCDLQKNQVSSQGEVPASSESLTHAVLYQLNARIKGVIHIHHSELWQQLKYQVPTTPEQVSYGTVEMAHAVQKLWAQSDLANQKILVMAGHAEGIFTFGETLSDALQTVTDYLT